MSVTQRIEQKLRDALGLRPRVGAQPQLQRALQRVCREHGLSPEDVLRRLDTEAWLVRCLGGALTVDETYFFRHPEHFGLLQVQVRDRLARQPPTPLLLWSAGCASGEEPYSMAIAIHRVLGPDGLRNVRIVASDVNQDALQTARRGVFGQWSFRAEGVDVRPGFFRPNAAGDEYQLIAGISQAVSFAHQTLSAQLLELAPGSADIVFFRNVAIYLTEDALARAYAGFARVLKEGGLLVLGPADPLPIVPEFVRQRLHGVLVHCKQTLRLPSYSQPPPVSRCRTPLGKGVPLRAPLPAASQSRAAAPSPQGTSEACALADARRLADRGLTGQALAIVDQQIARLGRNAERLGLRGRIHLAAGHAAQSVVDLQQALALDPSQVVLRFYCALGLEALSRAGNCRQELQALLQALQACSDDDTISDDTHTTVASLRRAAQELMRQVE